MTKNRKGSHYSHPTSKSKGKTYLSDLQIFGAEKTDEANPQIGNEGRGPKACFEEALTISKRNFGNRYWESMLGKNLPAFQWNIIFSMQKEAKTVRQLSEEFSIDPATIRRTLRRLIRHGFAAKVWHGKDTKTNRETPYYSSDPETVRFCQIRKEVQHGD